MTRLLPRRRSTTRPRVSLSEKPHRDTGSAAQARGRWTRWTRRAVVVALLRVLTELKFDRPRGRREKTRERERGSGGVDARAAMRLEVEEALAVVDGEEVLREDEGQDGHELHEDVERGARRVLERVADRVADDARVVVLLLARVLERAVRVFLLGEPLGPLRGSRASLVETPRGTAGATVGFRRGTERPSRSTSWRCPRRRRRWTS